jgi:hypothetical protein
MGRVLDSKPSFRFLVEGVIYNYGNICNYIRIQLFENKEIQRFVLVAKYDYGIGLTYRGE